MTTEEVAQRALERARYAETLQSLAALAETWLMRERRILRGDSPSDRDRGRASGLRETAEELKQAVREALAEMSEETP